MLLTTLTTAAAILAATLTGTPTAAPTPPAPAPIIQPALRLPAVAVPNSSPLTIQRATLRSEAPQIVVAPAAAYGAGGVNPLEAEYFVEPEVTVAAGTVNPVGSKRSGPGDVAPANTQGPSPSGSGSAIVNAARRHLGVPYIWGGTSTQGFDCSGLVQYVLRDLGVSMPQARAQATVGTRIPSLSEAQPGDLLGMRNGTHIAIYLGDNKILHSPRPGETVSIRALSASDDIDTIRRVL